MSKTHKTVMGLLKYECLLSESMKSIQDFLWSEGGFKKMTSRIINTPTESTKKIKSTKNTKTTKKSRKQESIKV